jgi:branched-chain amino acid transport system substrate-binding protein
MVMKPLWLARSAVVLAFSLVAASAAAEKRYGPGVTDTEIKIGGTAPYSGPASAYSTAALAELAYFKMLNEQGGVNGRKINLISLDDAYSPPKTVEQMRRLVESDNVLLIFNPVGTPSNVAIYKYLNQKGVPHLFVGSGAGRFNDPQHYPWTMSWTPHYASEGKIYARYMLQVKPDAKVGILWQNDDLGRDYISGFREALGDRAAKLIVKEVTYEVSDPTVDSQIATLKDSGADVFFNVTTPKFGAQAMRRSYDIGWHPLQFVVSIASSVSTVLQPAGFEKAKGLITAAYQRDAFDPRWKDDPAQQAWIAWMGKYNPQADKGDYYNTYGYNLGYALTQVLLQCGDDLSRENVMRQASNLNITVPLLLPGIRVRTTPTDLRPIKQMQLERFDGERWVLFGEILEGS